MSAPTYTAASKVCTKCTSLKPLSDFNRRSLANDGRQPLCRDCERVRRTAYQERIRSNPLRRAEERRKRQIWAKANPEKMHRYKIEDRLRKTYGMTPEEYEQLAATQNGYCALCGERSDRLQIDHDHVSGLVRGLLCGKCNRGIGLLGDDIPGLERALAYLRRAT